MRARVIASALEDDELFVHTQNRWLETCHHKCWPSASTINYYLRGTSDGIVQISMMKQWSIGIGNPLGRFSLDMLGKSWSFPSAQRQRKLVDNFRVRHQQQFRFVEVVFCVFQSLPQWQPSLIRLLPVEHHCVLRFLSRRRDDKAYWVIRQPVVYALLNLLRWVFLIWPPLATKEVLTYAHLGTS